MKALVIGSLLSLMSVSSFAGVLTCKGKNHVITIDSTKKVFKVNPGTNSFVKGEMPKVSTKDKSFFALNSDSGFAVFIDAKGKAELNYQGNTLESNIGCTGSL